MKKFDFAGISKGKLTGKEAGKLLIKHYFSELLDGKDKTPMTHDELKKTVNGIQGSFNIDTYHEYEEILKFLVNQSIYMSEHRNKIEIILWKLSFLLTSRNFYVKKPFDEEETKGLISMVHEANDLIKEFLFIQAMLEIIRKITGIEEISCFFLSSPYQHTRVVNRIIVDFMPDMPLIEFSDILSIISNNLEKTLPEVTDISDLYNEDKMRILLLNSLEKKEIITV